MDDLQKEALRRSRVFLVSNLMPETLWDHLVANDIFTDMMLEYVKCKSPRSEQIRSLLSDLSRRHRGAYQGFLKCLDDTGHGHCAQEIRNNMTKLLIEKGQSVIMTETLDPSPETGPTLGALPQDPSTPSSNVDVEMRDTYLSTVAQESLQSSGGAMFPQLDYWYYKDKDLAEVYRMESSPRGIVYMINNQTFPHLGNRDGSEKDRDKLQNLFIHLGFQVYIDNDLTALDMRKKLEAFSQFDRLSMVDSCIVVILSHGGRHRVFGVDATHNDGDSNYITDDYLKATFSNRSCTHLLGKPKLFLIQACRGSDEDLGIPSLSSNNSSSSFSSSTSSQDGSCVTQDVNRDVPPETMVSQTEAGTFLPKFSDMIIAHSSNDGYVSYRSIEDGSIFINEVVKVFHKHAHDTHMMDMLTKVNRKVATEFATNLGNKMMPQPTSLLLKKWYLNPVNNPVI